MKPLLRMTVVVMMCAAAPLFAQAPPDLGPSEDPNLPGVARHIIIEFLNLSPDQVSQWDDLIADREAAAQPLVDAIAGINAELEVLLSGDDPDPYEVGDLVIQRHDLGVELADVHRTYVEGFEMMLTEEQLGQYHFIRRAERAQPLFPSFRILGLLPPHWR